MWHKMDRISDFVTRRASWPISRVREDSHLPISNTHRSRIRMKAIFSNCFYRRILIWIFIVAICLVITYNPRLSSQSSKVFNLVNLRQGNSKGNADLEETVGLHAQGNTDESTGIQNNPDPEVEALDSTTKGSSAEVDETVSDNLPVQNGPQWLRYKPLERYYAGLKSLVSFSKYTPEYPRGTHSLEAEPALRSVNHKDVPRPRKYSPHPDYDSKEYRSTYVNVNPCYLDKERKLPAPDLFAYDGVPQGQPQPAIGSYDIFGIRQDICFDRFGRYGPYGLGYELERGGAGVGADTEKDGSDVIWEATGKIDYRGMNWGDAQERCFLDNQDRFLTGNITLDEELVDMHPERIDRIAVVIRLFTGFKWTSHTLLNFRAMITELNLRSGAEYDVHFLLHVHDNDAPIWADQSTVQKILDEHVPREFHGLCTLWSEAQMKLYYPGNFGDSFENPSGSDIHGVYRSAHMPLQHFAMMHPEYSHFWNWEMDMRWTGSYYELFDRLGKWAATQSRLGIWERSAKFYIPTVHGTWDNFTELVNQEIIAASKRPILGAQDFPGKTNLRYGEDFLPEGCTGASDLSQCGVGEDADIITLNPLFDADESGWVFAGDITGYDKKYDKPPRRSCIVTASRMSRRLLAVMHEETWRMHHSTFTEMFPPTMAFHHGLKAVYAPHPVYLDRAWPPEKIDEAFNGGRDRSTSGHGSPFDLTNEHNFRGTSWYYNSEFAGVLWRRWLGYAQADIRGDNSGSASQANMQGGRAYEEDAGSSGRMCLRSMLVHPIKWENPAEHSS